MNKEQRKQLEKVTSLLEEANSTVETTKDEQQEKFNNLSIFRKARKYYAGKQFNLRRVTTNKL